jgi:hypothetical protein
MSPNWVLDHGVDSFTARPGSLLTESDSRSFGVEGKFLEVRLSVFP